MAGRLSKRLGGLLTGSTMPLPRDRLVAFGIFAAVVVVLLILAAIGYWGGYWEPPP